MELYRWNWYRIISVFTIPSEWDDKGNIITISIMTFDEDEYFIDKDEVGGNGCRSSWKRSRVGGCLERKRGESKLIHLRVAGPYGLFPSV